MSRLTFIDAVLGPSQPADGGEPVPDEEALDGRSPEASREPAPSPGVFPGK